MSPDISAPLNRLRRCLPAASAAANPQATLDSLGFDSLDTVEFLCAVHEEFGVRLTNDDLFPGQSVHRLLARITARSREPQPSTIP
jgi:acyl carrier protein